MMTKKTFELDQLELDELDDIDSSWLVDIPKTQKELDEILNADFSISEEEKSVLSEKQLKELQENGVLEGEFIYENGKPVKFISIDEIFEELDE